MKKKSFRIDYEGDSLPLLRDMEIAIERGAIDGLVMVRITEIEEDNLRDIVVEKIKKIKKIKK